MESDLNNLMAITLQDVAKLAGVSVGTVSQALNHNPKVAAETRSRVLDAAKTLGYVFKERTSFFPQKSNSVSVIGVLSKHDVGDSTLVNPFYSHILAGIEDECRKRGMSLMFATVYVDDQNRPVEWPPMINNHLVNGLILVGTLIEKSAIFIQRHIDIPVVLIDGYAPSLFIDSVVTDNLQGAHLAMNHLIELGHQKIGLIGWHPNSPQSIMERYQGYVEVMQARGLDSKSYIEESFLSAPVGCRAAIALMKRHPDITALFACNDETAIGAMDGLKQIGLKVPDDISIVGFDNVRLTEDITPPLTTVHVHKNWLGIVGARLLLERAEFPEKPRSTTSIATQLVIRKTTAPPRSE